MVPAPEEVVGLLLPFRGDSTVGGAIPSPSSVVGAVAAATSALRALEAARDAFTALAASAAVPLTRGLDEHVKVGRSCVLHRK
jgi:hypothetical protein